MSQAGQQTSTVFSSLKLSRSSTDPRVTARRAALGIHHSAIIASVCHVFGSVLGMIDSPAMRDDLSNGLSGTLTLLIPFLAFLVFSALTQSRMGVPPTASETATPPELCTSGLFAYSRNPVYLAFVVPLAAIAVWSLSAAVAAIIVYLAATTRFVIRGEERALQATFGQAYDAYCRTTPRWLLV
jgi:protein-S-isoprenylcysteine O-methyltransferase Ste14